MWNINIAEIPNELICSVASLLDVSGLANLATTSSRMHALLTTRFWIDKTRKDFPQYPLSLIREILTLVDFPTHIYYIVAYLANDPRHKYKLISVKHFLERAGYHNSEYLINYFHGDEYRQRQDNNQDTELNNLVYATTGSIMGNNTVLTEKLTTLSKKIFDSAETIPERISDNLLYSSLLMGKNNVIESLISTNKYKQSVIKWSLYLTIVHNQVKFSKIFYDMLEDKRTMVPIICKLAKKYGRSSVTKFLGL